MKERSAIGGHSRFSKESDHASAQTANIPNPDVARVPDRDEHRTKQHQYARPPVARPLPDALVTTSEAFVGLLVRVRCLAGGFCYSGPVVWRISPGFLRAEDIASMWHGDQFGSSDLALGELLRPEHTPDSLAMFIPRWFVDAVSLRLTQEAAVVAAKISHLGLPAALLLRRATLSIMLALLHSYALTFGEPLSLLPFWIRTGTILRDGRRIQLSSGRDGPLLRAVQDDSSDDTHTIAFPLVCGAFKEWT